jgi:hypothetical protein
MGFSTLTVADFAFLAVGLVLAAAGAGFGLATAAALVDFVRVGAAGLIGLFSFFARFAVAGVGSGDLARFLLYVLVTTIVSPIVIFVVGRLERVLDAASLFGGIFVKKCERMSSKLTESLQ